VTRHNAALNQARDLEHQAHVDKAIREALNTTHHTEQLAEANMRPTHYMTTDSQALRGIPAIGGRGSVGGAIQGTRPDTLAWDDDRHKQPRTRNPRGHR
jgi:hypothetical protein